MPNRILREGILTSPRMAKLSWAAEVFYRRLHSIVDDFGRYHADPMLLRAACYPRQLDKVSDSDIGKWMLETAEAGLVRGFEHAGEPYIELLDFRQQVRATKSKFPEPPADATQVLRNNVADAKPLHTKTKTYSKSDSETETGDKAAAGAAPVWPAPDDVLRETWDGFLEIRKRKNAPITKHAYTLIVRTLSAVRLGGGSPEETVSRSVMSGWTGIFAGKGPNGHGKQAALEAKNKAVADAWVPPELRGKDAAH